MKIAIIIILLIHYGLFLLVFLVNIFLGFTIGIKMNKYLKSLKINPELLFQKNAIHGFEIIYYEENNNLCELIEKDKHFKFIFFKLYGAYKRFFLLGIYFLFSLIIVSIISLTLGLDH